MLAIVAAVIAHLAWKPNEETPEDAGVNAGAERPPTATAGGDAERMPDVSDPAALRAYVSAIEGRIRLLEEEVSALKSALDGAPDPLPWTAALAPARTPVPSFSTAHSYAPPKPADVEPGPQPETLGPVPEPVRPEVAPQFEPPPIVSPTPVSPAPPQLDPGAASGPTWEEGPAEPSFLSKVLSKAFS